MEDKRIIMRIPSDLLGLYMPLSPEKLFYIKVRWRIIPVEAIERMVPQKGRIYDIGCGAGLLSNLLALRSGQREVIGIDLSKEKILISKNTVKDRKNVRFEQGDILDYIFRDPDVVVACDMLHHIPFERQRPLIEHIYAALKKGGLLLVQDIDKAPWHKYLFALGVDKVLNKMEKTYYRRSEELVDILRETGFVVEMRRIDRGYPIAAVMYLCRKFSK